MELGNGLASRNRTSSSHAAESVSTVSDGPPQAASLELGTQLAATPGRIVVHADCGEAVWVAATGSTPSEPAPSSDSEDASSTAWSMLPQEERDARNRTRSSRRARTRIRRLATANRMTYLWSLTYAVEPSDVDAVNRDLEAFFKRLARIIGSTLARIAVVEHGSKSGRLHAHFVTPVRVAHADVERAWGHGFVFVSNHGSGHASARRAAGYVAKYVAKSIDEGRSGRQSYLVSEGLDTGRTITRKLRADDALDFARMVLGSTAGGTLSLSADWDDHDGPVAWWFGSDTDP